MTEPNGEPNGGNNDDGPKFTQADLDRAISERLAREKSKYADYGELRKFREQALTDNEKAIAEAEKRGAASVTAKVAQRLTRAEFVAAAGGKVTDLEDRLEDIDYSKYVGEDGEPDTTKIQKRVEKWIPKEGSTNFDGGPRGGTHAPKNMNELIRRQAGVV